MLTIAGISVQAIEIEIWRERYKGRIRVCKRDLENKLDRYRENIETDTK